MRTHGKDPKTGWWAVLVGVTLIFGGPSRALASLFGEENITLAAILAEALEHTAQLRNTFEQVKKTTAFARDTALFTKESVQVARNIRAIIDQPSLFSSYIQTSWSQAFPDLAESIRNVEAVREAMGQVATGDGILVYDPHAFVRAIDALGNLRGGGFEVMAHAVDFWGVNDPHDEAIRAIHQLHTESADNLDVLNKAIAGDGMTAREAAVHGARAQALTAEAQIRTASTMERLARTVELQAMRDMAADAKAASQDHDMVLDATQMHVQGWRLDPLGGGASVEPGRRRQ